MAVVLAMSPSVYTTPAKRVNALTTGGSSVSIGAGGRNGGNAFILFNNSGFGAECQAPLPAAIGEVWYSFDMVINVLPAAGVYIDFAALLDGGVAQITARLNSLGFISIWRGSTQIAAASGFAVAINTHCHFGWRALISATVGELQLWINDTSLVLDHSSSLNTKATSNATVDGVSWICRSGGTQKFCDIVVDDAVWNGNSRVREDVPTGTGSQDDFTANGAATTRECVDEGSDPNDDTDYASAVNIGDKSLWTYPALPSDSVVIALSMMHYAKLTAAGTGKLKAAYKVGGNDYLGTEKAPSTSSYAYHADDFHMVSPDTSSAWTIAEVNAAEFGAERSS